MEHMLKLVSAEDKIGRVQPHKQRTDRKLWLSRHSPSFPSLSRSSSNQLLVAGLLHSCPTWTGKNFCSTRRWRKLESFWNARNWARVLVRVAQIGNSARGGRTSIYTAVLHGHWVTWHLNLMQLKYLSRVTKYLHLHISRVCWLMTQTVIPLHQK